MTRCAVGAGRWMKCERTCHCAPACSMIIWQCVRCAHKLSICCIYKHHEKSGMKVPRPLHRAVIVVDLCLASNGLWALVRHQSPGVRSALRSGSESRQTPTRVRACWCVICDTGSRADHSFVIRDPALNGQRAINLFQENYASYLVVHHHRA